MKSKEIYKLIEGLESDQIREKCEVFRNSIEMVFSMKEKEQLEAFQSIFLYSLYGISPNFCDKSIQFQSQMNMIFSLLKCQRIGWVNSCKSTNKGVFTPTPTPIGEAGMGVPPQDIKNKDIKNKEKRKKEEEEKKEEVFLSSSSYFLEIYNSTSKPFGEIELSESQSKIISGRTETEINTFWGEVELSEWLKGQPFGKVLNLFDNVVSGQYRGKVESVSKTPTREDIERIIHG